MGVEFRWASCSGLGGGGGPLRDAGFPAPNSGRKAQGWVKKVVQA